jgi:hypothetical protein
VQEQEAFCKKRLAFMNFNYILTAEGVARLLFYVRIGRSRRSVIAPAFLNIKQILRSRDPPKTAGLTNKFNV